jgi:hypothetical protein
MSSISTSESAVPSYSGKAPYDDLDETLLDAEEEIFDLENNASKRKRGEVYVYKFFKNYDCLEDAQASLAEQYIYVRRRLSKDAVNITYKCRFASCPVNALIKIIAVKNREIFSVHKSETEHDHTKATNIGLPDEVKKMIKKFYTNGIQSPKAIIRALENDEEFDPESLSTITNKYNSIRNNNRRFFY